MALSGAEWYSQQAHRAVNQAIGRVIRHRQDYGAILFLDSRFSESRHQQGVSKWIRPRFENSTGDGVGHSIKPLVSFFRKAAEKAAANKTLIEKLSDANRKPELKYDVESDVRPENIKPSYDNISKIAIVSKPVDSTSMDDYILPNQIIKEVELNHEISSRSQQGLHPDPVPTHHKQNDQGLDGVYNLAKKKESNTKSIRTLTHASKTDISSTIKSAWSGIRPIQTAKISSTAMNSDCENASKEKNKELAKGFFELASRSLSEHDFSEVKKLLVEMKSSGDKNDQEDYITSANKMVKLLLKYDTTRKRFEEESVGILMLDYLYLLLPIAHRTNISNLISKTRYHKSPLKTIIQGLLENSKNFSNDLQVLNVSVPLLLADLDKSKRDGALRMNNSQMNDFRAIVSILHRYGVSNNVDMLQALYNLFPASFYGTAQLIVHEIRDKHAVLQSMESQRRESITNNISEGKSVQNPYNKKRSANTHAPTDRNHYDPPTHSTGNIQKRSKQVTDIVPHITPSEDKPSTAQGLDPVDRYLLQAKNDLYRSKESKIARINRKIDSNLPDETSCTLCGNTVKALFMAKECYHFFCLECWTNWLKRSLTCPKCRVPTSLESLSRVVFEQKIGSGAPSFTQICESDEESEDSDLEIMKPI